ncbi:MAG TPA: hypothetical protein VF263_21720 [Longimicrobiaceae bacterium]
MSSEMIGLIGVVIGALAAFVTTLPVLIPWFRDWRAGGRQEYKYCYVKVVHLTRREDGRAPVYRAYVPRLDQKVPVYDEYHYFRLNVFRWPRGVFTCTDRSSGVVDLQILHPWHDGGKLVFTDRGAGLQPGTVSQTVRKKSNVFFTKSIYYNGLQSGHENVAMKMEHHTGEARMIVDFSSIPNFEQLVPMPDAVECTPDRETQINARKLAPGIFSVSAVDVAEETVLRLDFAFRWEAAAG